MNKKECNVFTLENNIEYTEIERIEYNNNTYLVLSDLENPENFCIRKLKIENNEEYIVGIDTKEEFDTILNLFSNKYLD